MADKIIKRPDTPLAETPTPNFSFTSRYEKVQTNQAKNEKAGKVPAGLNVSDGKATAKPYEKRFIPADKNRSDALIVDSGNKTVKKSVTGSQKSREDLRTSFVKDSTDTMQRRNSNSNFYNVASGSKKDLSESDKKSLISLGKAKIK